MELGFNIEKGNLKNTITTVDDVENVLKDLRFDNSPELDPRKMFSDDDEAFDRWSTSGTVYLRLRGGASNIDSLSSVCQDLIGKIVENSYVIRGLSIALRDNLINDNVIGPDTTYQEVVENGKLKSLIYDTIKLKLQENPKLSQFGGGVVSDFDLMVNLQVNEKFNDRMKQLNIAEESEEFKKLKTARGSLRRFVGKIRDSIILMMELPETPTKQEIVKEKKQRNDKTKEDVEKSITIAKESLKRDGSSICTSDDSTVNDDNEFPLSDQVSELCERRKFLGQRSSEQSTTFDEYATHSGLITPLIEHLRLPLDDYVIWDPCCGSLNAICKEFNKEHYTTLSTDIQYLDLEEFSQLDFLTYDEDTSDKFIVTNPPWSNNKQFLHKLVSLNIPFCCLMKLEVLGTKYLRDILTSKSYDYPFHGLPLPKGRFYCVETGKDIQMSGVFWLIGNYIPRGYEIALEQCDNVRTCPLIMKAQRYEELKDEAGAGMDT
jgi:hypothetical protein